jgi:hypothetical protein
MLMIPSTPCAKTRSVSRNRTDRRRANRDDTGSRDDASLSR